ncbi:hypothetical protein GY45DRAFT_955942 [Cubamyces sp. BRFM 1775]|nr:hypothetical protein GY45DRAFT_955942 [Cubamyces sp. BRFM 1775]
MPHNHHARILPALRSRVLVRRRRFCRATQPMCLLLNIRTQLTSALAGSVQSLGCVNRGQQNTGSMNHLRTTSNSSNAKQ